MLAVPRYVSCTWCFLQLIFSFVTSALHNSLHTNPWSCSVGLPRWERWSAVSTTTRLKLRFWLHCDTSPWYIVTYILVWWDKRIEKNSFCRDSAPCCTLDTTYKRSQNIDSSVQKKTHFISVAYRTTRHQNIFSKMNRRRTASEWVTVQGAKWGDQRLVNIGTKINQFFSVHDKN